MRPYFSVVIPTFNRIEVLIRVLEALDAQVDAPSFEVILIDDGSKDDTARHIPQFLERETPRYELIFESQKNSGPGQARNRGVLLARGLFVVFIGDDTVPEPAFLAEHARIHRDSSDNPLLACLGYTGWPLGGRVTAFMDYINDYGLQFGYRLIEHDAIVPFNFFYTSNISLATQTLLDHPFDTSFPAAAWEDIELAFRLDSKGVRIRYNERAVTRHHHPTSVDSFERRQYTAGRSGAIFYSKHPELGHFLGVNESRDRLAPSQRRMRWLRLVAKLGERFRPFASKGVFEELMREHYLRGLREGLSRLESPVE